MSSGSVSNSGSVNFNQFSNDFDSQFTTLGMAKKEMGSSTLGWLSHKIIPGYKSSLQKKVDTNKCKFMEKFDTHCSGQKVDLSALRKVANELPQDFFEAHKGGSKQKASSQPRDKAKILQARQKFDEVKGVMKTFKEFKSAIRSGDGAKLKKMMKDPELMKFMISEPQGSTNGTPLFQVSDEIKQPRELAKLVNVVNQDDSISQDDKKKAIQETIRGMLENYSSGCIDEFYRNIDVKKTGVESLKAILEVSLGTLDDKDSKCKGILADRILDQRSEAIKIAFPFSSQDRFQAYVKEAIAEKNSNLKQVLYPEADDDPWEGNKAVEDRRDDRFINHLAKITSDKAASLNRIAFAIYVRDEVGGLIDRTCRDPLKIKQAVALEVARSVDLGLDKKDIKRKQSNLEKCIGLGLSERNLSDEEFATEASQECLEVLKTGDQKIIDRSLQSILSEIKKQVGGIDNKKYNTLKLECSGKVINKIITQYRDKIDVNEIYHLKKEDSGQFIEEVKDKLHLISRPENPINKIMRGSESIELKQAVIRDEVSKAFEESSLNVLVSALDVRAMSSELLETLFMEIITKGTEQGTDYSKCLEKLALKVLEQNQVEKDSADTFKLILPFCSQNVFNRCAGSLQKHYPDKVGKILYPQENDCKWPETLDIQDRRQSKIVNYVAHLVKGKLEDPNATLNLGAFHSAVFQPTKLGAGVLTFTKKIASDVADEVLKDASDATIEKIGNFQDVNVDRGIERYIFDALYDKKAILEEE